MKPLVEVAASEHRATEVLDDRDREHDQEDADRRREDEHRPARYAPRPAVGSGRGVLLRS